MGQRSLVAYFGLVARPVTSRAFMNSSNPGQQTNIFSYPSTPAALAPRIVAAGGDSRYTADGGNLVLGLIHLDEPEAPDGIESVSRANQAATFL